MLENLKEEVFKANLLLPEYKLITFTWGNVSAIDRKLGLVVIKPSGVSYEVMKASDMVVCDLDGKVVEGNLKPSSDLMTHLEFYKNFKDIKAVVHTHSSNATSFAQANKDIMALGTTHGDYFYGDIPCTRQMTPEEIKDNYELNTGKVIVEEFRTRKLDPNQMPGVLVANHGPFTWGTSAENAVHNSVVLEELAKMARNTLMINSESNRMSQNLLDKHYLRKHGANAYYGQK